MGMLFSLSDPLPCFARFDVALDAFGERVERLQPGPVFVGNDFGVESVAFKDRSLGRSVGAQTISIDWVDGCLQRLNLLLYVRPRPIDHVDELVVYRLQNRLFTHDSILYAE